MDPAMLTPQSGDVPQEYLAHFCHLIDMIRLTTPAFILSLIQTQTQSNIAFSPLNTGFVDTSRSIVGPAYFYRSVPLETNLVLKVKIWKTLV